MYVCIYMHDYIISISFSADVDKHKINLQETKELGLKYFSISNTSSLQGRVHGGKINHWRFGVDITISTSVLSHD